MENKTLENESATKSNEQKMYCSVINSNALETGLESECTFDMNGGKIGSSPTNSWVLTDYNGAIYANHCAIVIIDNAYCLIDHSGNTFINYASMPLETGVPVIISPNDVITIGPYHIKVHFFYEEAIDSLTIHKKTLGSMFAESEGNVVPDIHDYAQGETMNRVDPLMALGESSSASMAHINKYDEMAWNKTEGSAKSDYSYHMDSVIGDHSYDQHNKPAFGFDPYNQAPLDDHLATGPLMRGLGVTLTHSDHSGEMQYVAEEMGASLRETIKGLLKIHRQVSNNHYGVLNKNFQPIIDNPLRMGLSYEETVHLLYDANVSMVHLAPPAAINESLKMVHDHQSAVHVAISEALEQILFAFSPEALLKRFHYYRAARKLHGDNSDGWAWKMYQAFYRELISNRQTGFKKLFWEIFDQVYDKEMRTLQQEGLMHDDEEDNIK